MASVLMQLTHLPLLQCHKSLQAHPETCTQFRGAHLLGDLTVQTDFTLNCPRLQLSAEIFYSPHNREDLSKSSGDCLDNPKYLTLSQSANYYI